MTAEPSPAARLLPPTALAVRSTVSEDGMLEVSLDEADLGAPEADEVVIRVEAAPLNPSDLGLLFAGADLEAATANGIGQRPGMQAPIARTALPALRGRFGQPMRVGNEGAGVVVAAGSSPNARRLLGSVVSTLGGGMYAELRRVKTQMCMPLPPGVTAAQGAAAWVNPMTALGIVETTKTGGHRGLVHTAAASNVGRMVQRLADEEQLALINVVRSPVQAQRLRDDGAEWALDSSSPTFHDDLVDALRQTGVTAAFDAIGGGTLQGDILTAMDLAQTTDQPYSRYGSTAHKQVYLYGNLDRRPTVLHRTFGMAWSVSGWVLNAFLSESGPGRVAELAQRISAGIMTTFASEFSDRIGLRQLVDPDMARQFSRLATGHKYLVVPSEPAG